MHTVRVHAPRGLSSRRIVVLWCARRSHVVAPRVYESPPPPCVTLRIDVVACVFNPSMTVPATSTTFARVHRDGVHREETFTNEPSNHVVVRRRSVDSARRRWLAADSAHSTSERTGAADSRGSASLCHPPPARHRAARRALVTPTYSPLLANTPSELLVVFSF